MPEVMVFCPYLAFTPCLRENYMEFDVIQANLGQDDSEVARQYIGTLDARHHALDNTYQAGPAWLQACWTRA